MEGMLFLHGISLIRQRTLQVDHGKFILLKIVDDISEGITVVLPYGLDKAITCKVVGRIAAEGAVTNEGQLEPFLLELGFRGDGGGFRSWLRGGICNRRGGWLRVHRGSNRFRFHLSAGC